ncbi:hypothetical protein QFZ32_001222 [Streptomyces canus]|uniref:Transcriptional regulator LacI/GalR-like sensor domain-containing protein n=1 Tax=Streptomyces canus TaxID=58343 RepID=A0AAW8F8G4_9ACTN|nr:hypothetical protein [Streptomyces canus]MDQ0905838.1 hypothetical protein [Streptomyces canus]MDQ1065782.1 hypothetical protein [Streptomyces canus]
MDLLMPPARAGVEVPRDMSVVGYDDSHLSHPMPIGLTTVRQDAVLMAERAVRFAVERLENPQLEPHEAVWDPKLVVRGTKWATAAGSVRKVSPRATAAVRAASMLETAAAAWTCPSAGCPGAEPPPQPSYSRSLRYSVARPMPSTAAARDLLPP